MNRFRALRMELNQGEKEFTQDRLAEKLGISQKRISLLENGKEPSLAEAKAYHAFFDVPYEYLLGEPGSTRNYENLGAGKVFGFSDRAISNFEGIGIEIKNTINWLVEQTYIKKSFKKDSDKCQVEQIGLGYEFFSLLSMLLKSGFVSLTLPTFSKSQSWRDSQTGKLLSKDSDLDAYYLDVDLRLMNEASYLRVISLLKELSDLWAKEHPDYTVDLRKLLPTLFDSPE